MSRIRGAAAVLLLFAFPSAASIEIRAGSDTAGEVQCIPAAVIGEIVTMHVVVTGSDAVSATSFRLAIPPRLVFLEDEHVFPHTTGISVLGATVTFDDCLVPPIHVLTVRCLVLPDEAPECPFVTVEEPSAADCASQAVAATAGASRVPRGTCTIAGPSDPTPVDHAENVPLDAVLEWTTVAATGGCSLGDWELFQDLYFGTTPDPSRIMQGFAYPPFDPGELQPGTQYYWGIRAFQYWGNPVMGPVWTFRTAGMLSAEPTTWGRIKALYRD